LSEIGAYIDKKTTLKVTFFDHNIRPHYANLNIEKKAFNKTILDVQLNHWTFPK